MLLRLIKSQQSLVLILAPLIGIVLWLGAFIEPETLEVSSQQMPLYQLISDWVGTNSLFLTIIAFVLVLLQAILLLVFNKTNVFLDSKILLPVLFFILITGSFRELHYLHPIIPANLFLILAINRILDSYKQNRIVSNSFDSAFLVAIASLFYLPMGYFILLVWAGLYTLKTLSLRENIVMLVGFATPYLLVMSYYFFQDALPEFYSLMYENITASSTLGTLNLYSYIFYALLGVIALISIMNLYLRLISRKVITRKYYVVFLWVLILALLVTLVTPASFEMVFVLAIPLSYIISHYVNEIRARWWREVIAILFVSLLFYIQFAN